MEHVREVNALLQTLQDSHAAVSAWDWMWAVEREHGSVPIRWALEGDALWVAASAVDGLSAGTRVLSLNGMDAAQCAAVARDLGNVEGRSPVGQARTGVHSLTAWVMGQTQSDSLHVKWLDRATGAVESHGHSRRASSQGQSGLEADFPTRAVRPVDIFRRAQRTGIEWGFPPVHFLVFPRPFWQIPTPTLEGISTRQ